MGTGQGAEPMYSPDKGGGEVVKCPFSKPSELQGTREGDRGIAVPSTVAQSPS